MLVGLQNGAATMERGVENLRKAKMNLPYDPEIPLFGIVTKDVVSYTIDTYSAVVITALFPLVGNGNNLNVL